VFVIPSLKELIARSRAAFKAEANLDASLPLNNVYPFANVIGGHDLHLHLRMGYIIDQAFALRADETWLGEHAKEYNIPRKPAALATGNVAVVSTGDISIPVGTLFTRLDDIVYSATSAVSLSSAGTINVPVVAQETGSLANSEAGTELVIGSGPTGAGADTATASVGADGIIGGADVEDVESWRSRILFRKRFTPHGGAASDYVMWAGAVPGVTRTFVERLYAGPGTVRVFPIFDDYFDGGVATTPYIEAVIAALAIEQPASAVVSVIAPAAHAINVTVTGLAPFTTSVQEAVLAELKDTVRRLGRVSGGDTESSGLPFLATPHTFSRSWIWQAIANATGEERHVLVDPAADIVVPTASIPVLGTVTLSA
jgi:uncharacterized phage protein gp47/JayE